MNITNGNGKRKNGKAARSAKDLSLVHTLPPETQDTEQTEPMDDIETDINNDTANEINADAAPSLSDTAQSPTPPLPETEPAPAEPNPHMAENPEDVLRAARNAENLNKETSPKTQDDTVTGDTASPEKPKGDIAPRTTSAAISEATAQVAQNLVQADRQAAQERLQGGLREGYLDAKDFRQGWQIGFMKGVTEAKQKDSAEFLAQLELLRQHTDVTSGQEIDALLGKMGIQSPESQQKGNEQPKDETALDLFSRLVDPSLPTDHETLTILNLAQKTPLAPTQQASSPG